MSTEYPLDAISLMADLSLELLARQLRAYGAPENVLTLADTAVKMQRAAVAMQRGQLSILEIKRLADSIPVLIRTIQEMGGDRAGLLAELLRYDDPSREVKP